ncbi:Lethal(2) giant larvae sro7 [Zalaria obscura]|uniref:Lethal(2) giant larvae sro7 n=1 Tax=Zalaria obscura TaxID=2024903 RepID=A0ACC3SPL8_9PEZI
MSSFCADKLVCLDDKHDLTFFSLEAKRAIASFSPPGVATSLLTDPMLDYAFLGMQTGDILAFDLDRETLAPFRISNLWAEFDSRARVSPIVTMQLHPRDIGKLLVGYTHGAAIYSFKQAKAQQWLQYEVPRGAPGGDSDPSLMNTIRRPRLTQAVWHPTGTFVLTGHEDGSLVFWDPKEGRKVMARTLSETNVDRPGASPLSPHMGSATFAMKEPLFRIAWCANGQDPDDTGILIAGGASTTIPTKGLTFFELGRTPVYATSSYEVLAAHIESPKRQRILPTPPSAEVVDFCLIPRSSPHFNGAHDPIAVLALLSSGEVITLSFPSGIPITPTNQLHVSMTFVHPFVKIVKLTPVERTRWLGMTETRSQGPLILKGGAEATHPLRRYESRNIVHTAHADGTVRLWDAGHGDELENEKVVQVDVARAAGRVDGADITVTSLAGGSGEFGAGLRTGEIVIFRWGTNRNLGREPRHTGDNKPNALTNIVERTDPALKEGLLPFTLLDMQNGPITALKLSDVGFVAVASEGGSISVVDLRGPAIIYNANLQDFVKGDKKGSFRRSSAHGAPKADYVTALEFSVMTLEGDGYSSILMHAGTHLGHLATFKVIPDSSGRYTVQYVGSSTLDGRVIYIAPVSADTGRPATASPNAVAVLRNGAKTEGALVVVTHSEIRISKPPTAKGAHKSFDNFFCDAAGIARYQDAGYALIGLFGDGTARAFSLPALKEIGSQKLDQVMDVRRFSEATVTPSGNILGWTGPSEMSLVTVWGTGEPLPKSQDRLFNPDALIPPRPTISNLQWISGTQYITPADMDVLIGGPDRPPSKRMIAQAKADELEARRAAVKGASGSAASEVGQGQGGQEGYYAWMQRQITERTEKLGIMGDRMDELESNSSGWADDVSKFVQRQKRNAVMGGE